MKRVIKRILLFLLLLPLILMLLAAGLLLPDAVFTYLDTEKQAQTFQEQMDAMDLTFTENLNLYDRMKLLTMEDSTVHEGAWDTVSDADRIETAAFVYMERMYYTADQEMPESYAQLYKEAHLYTSTSLQQSAVFWEVVYFIEEDGIYLTLLLDDETQTIVGLSADSVGGVYNNSYDPAVLSPYCVQKVIRDTIGTEIPVWVANNSESLVFHDEHGNRIPAYEQYTLNIWNGEKYYQYVMGVTENRIVFNLAEYRELKDQVEKDIAEYEY